MSMGPDAVVAGSQEMEMVVVLVCTHGSRPVEHSMSVGAEIIMEQKTYSFYHSRSFADTSQPHTWCHQMEEEKGEPTIVDSFFLIGDHCPRMEERPSHCR